MRAMSCQPIRRLSGFIFAVAIVFSATAEGQQRQRENVRCAGKVKAVGPGVLHVIGEEGQQWLVAVEARPQNISFQGTASPGFLRPGMLVQFRTTLNKKAEAQEPITEMKVITPREGIQLGVVPEGGFGGTELFSDDDEGVGKKKKKTLDDKPYSITGTLRSVKDRKFYVASAGIAIKGELAENCSVSLDVADYSLAREGDPIQITGWHFAGQPNQIYANNVEIKAEKPLIAPEDAKKRKQASKKAGEDDSQAESSTEEAGTDKPEKKASPFDSEKKKEGSE